MNNLKIKLLEKIFDEKIKRLSIDFLKSKFIIFNSWIIISYLLMFCIIFRLDLNHFWHACYQVWLNHLYQRTMLNQLLVRLNLLNLYFVIIRWQVGQHWLVLNHLGSWQKDGVCGANSRIQSCRSQRSHHNHHHEVCGRNLVEDHLTGHSLEIMKCKMKVWIKKEKLESAKQ